MLPTDPHPLLDADLGDWYRLPGESLEDWDTRIRRLVLTDEQSRSEDAAREYREREESENESLAAELDLRPVLSVFLTHTLPERSARRARAIHVLYTLRSTGHSVEWRHCDVRVTPAPAEAFSRVVDDLRPELADLLLEGEA